MRKQRTIATAPTAFIKLGATYRDRNGTLVTAEDFESGPRGRTGRVVVCAADGLRRFPRRWYCRAIDMVEVPEQGDLPLIPADGGKLP